MDILFLNPPYKLCVNNESFSFFLCMLFQVVLILFENMKRKKYRNEKENQYMRHTVSNELEIISQNK